MRSPPHSQASAPHRPLLDLRVAVVGPGRVGRSLGLWCEEAGAEIVGVVCRPGSNPELPWSDTPIVSLEELRGRRPDLLLVTVPDSALPTLARQLSESPSGSVALHAAGAHDRSVLAPLEAVGLATGSLHPLIAFPGVLASPPEPPVWFGVDGSPEALQLAERLVAAWRGRSLHVTGETRALYHLAASLAAGGVATVLALALGLMEKLGLPREAAGAYLSLARGALDRVEEANPPTAGLTGPAARGDIATMDRHLRALRDSAPHLEAIVRELAITTAESAREVPSPQERLDRLEAFCVRLRQDDADGGERSPVVS